MQVVLWSAIGHLSALKASILELDEMAPRPHRVLSLNGGAMGLETGNVDQLRDTLLTPLTKSIQAGEWQRVILLPSKVTADNAAQLQNELAQFAIEIQPLPVAGAEDNADACFAHFDRVIEELRNAGNEPQQILADFTRGTKAMSAALALAAIRHELPPTPLPLRRPTRRTRLGRPRHRICPVREQATKRLPLGWSALDGLHNVMASTRSGRGAGHGD